MKFPQSGSAVRSAVLALTAVVALVAASGVQAASPVAVSTITLSAPGGIIGDSTPLDLADGPFAGDGVHLAAGDGSNIGAWMLTGEYISFADSAIQLRINAGQTDDAGALVTGYLGLGTDHALYDFAGLSVGGLAVASFNAVALGGTGSTPSDVNSLVHLTGGNSLSIDLDTLVFDPANCGGTGNCFVEFRIDLTASTTPPVPEPGTIPLMLAGGALVAAAVRRQRRVR